MSHEALNPTQFTKIPIEKIRSGMIVKPTWGDYPFERAMGNAVYDPGHPKSYGEGGEDPVKMFVIPYTKRYSPHQAEGTMYHRMVRKRGIPPQ